MANAAKNCTTQRPNLPPKTYTTLRPHPPTAPRRNLPLYDRIPHLKLVQHHDQISHLLVCALPAIAANADAVLGSSTSLSLGSLAVGALLAHNLSILRLIHARAALVAGLDPGKP